MLTGAQWPEIYAYIFQVKGKAATDSMELGELGLKQNFKLMMMGRWPDDNINWKLTTFKLDSLEETIAETQTVPENLPEVLNDFEEEEEVRMEGSRG